MKSAHCGVQPRHTLVADACPVWRLILVSLLCLDVIVDGAAVDDDEDEVDDDDEDEGDAPDNWWTYWQDPPDNALDDSHEQPLRMTAKEKVREAGIPQAAHAFVTSPCAC